MSVIGRLDEQVAAVLIAPLRRSAEPEAPPPEAPPQKETAASQLQRETRADEPSARRRTQSELPVWLL